MEKTFEEILQESIRLRRDKKVEIKSTITSEELDAIQRRQHVENTFHINQKFGRFGSKDNVLAR